MIYTLQKVSPKTEEPVEYNSKAEALKAVLNECGDQIESITIEECGPLEAVGDGKTLEEENHVIKIGLDELATDVMEAKLRAAGMVEDPADLAFAAKTVFEGTSKAGGIPKGTLTGLTCSTKVRRGEKLCTYCLELPLPPPPDAPVPPPKTIREDILKGNDKDNEIVAIDGGTTLEAVNRAYSILAPREDIFLPKLPTRKPDVDLWNKPGALRERDGQEFLKRVIDENVTVFIWQGKTPTKVIDTLHRSTLKLFDFVFGYGCKERVFNNGDLRKNEGYEVSIPAEIWLRATGAKAIGSAYRELVECLETLMFLGAEYTAVSKRGITEGWFTLVQAAYLENYKKTGKRVINVVFSAPYSHMLNDLTKKQMFVKIPQQAFLADCQARPLAFPLAHQLAQHTAQNLRNLEQRNSIRVGTLLGNLRGQLKPYEEYKNPSDWRRKIVGPLLRDLHYLLSLGALIGYRLEWSDGTGAEDRPPKTYKELESIKLRYWLNIDEDGEPPQVDFIAENIGPEEMRWGRYGVCSVGRRTIPKIYRKQARKRIKSE